jgi:hypothetical protein
VSKAYATVNGIPAQRVRVFAGNVGPWRASVDLASDEPLAGRVTIHVGPLTLDGTVIEQHSGAYAAERRLVIVAGAGAWGAEVRARAYHNDAGVKAKLVAEDAAHAVGETLGSFVPAAVNLTADYAHETCPAVTVLEDVAGPGVAWWVDYSGVTHVGVRPAGARGGAGYHGPHRGGDREPDLAWGR